MKQLVNDLNQESRFDDVASAIAYYIIENEELKCNEDVINFNNELSASKTLEEVVEVLNRYSDITGNGSSFSVKEF